MIMILFQLLPTHWNGVWFGLNFTSLPSPQVVKMITSSANEDNFVKMTILPSYSSSSTNSSGATMLMRQRTLVGGPAAPPAAWAAFPLITDIWIRIGACKVKQNNTLNPVRCCHCLSPGLLYMHGDILVSFIEACLIETDIKWSPC